MWQLGGALPAYVWWPSELVRRRGGEWLGRPAMQVLEVWTSLLAGKAGRQEGLASLAGQSSLVSLASLSWLGCLVVWIETRTKAALSLSLSICLSVCLTD